jgi:hypothetical protein
LASLGPPADEEQAIVSASAESALIRLNGGIEVARLVATNLVAPP